MNERTIPSFLATTTLRRDVSPRRIRSREAKVTFFSAPETRASAMSLTSLTLVFGETLSSNSWPVMMRTLTLSLTRGAAMASTSELCKYWLKKWPL